MAPHSSTLAWKIPWTEGPGGLQSMGSLSRTQLSDFTFTFHFHALEKEMATHSSVLAWRIPGTGSLVGCRLWGRTESDTTEALSSSSSSNNCSSAVCLITDKNTRCTKMHLLSQSFTAPLFVTYNSEQLCAL